MEPRCTCDTQPLTIDGDRDVCSYCVNKYNEILDNVPVSPKVSEKMGELVHANFALARQPHVYIVQVHMRNILNTHPNNDCPQHLYELHFDNWVSTYGLAVVEEALTMMGLGLNGEVFNNQAV